MTSRQVQAMATAASCWSRWFAIASPLSGLVPKNGLERACVQPLLAGLLGLTLRFAEAVDQVIEGQSFPAGDDAHSGRQHRLDARKLDRRRCAGPLLAAEFRDLAGRCAGEVHLQEARLLRWRQEADLIPRFGADLALLRRLLDGRDGLPQGVQPRQHAGVAVDLLSQLLGGRSGVLVQP